MIEETPLHEDVARDRVAGIQASVKAAVRHTLSLLQDRPCVGFSIETLDILQITNEDEQKQRKRLNTVKHDRDAEAVEKVLAKLATEAADPEVNLMPTLVEASHAYATLGEMMSTMESMSGEIGTRIANFRAEVNDALMWNKSEADATVAELRQSTATVIA